MSAMEYSGPERRRRQGEESVRILIVDDEDPRDLIEVSTIRTAPTAIGPAVLGCAHQLSSPPTAGSVGMARRTTVPPSGRDRTSNRAPISSARSRMN